MQMPERPTARDIRQYADGELPPQDISRVERAVEADPRLREAVAFEGQLRSRVKSLMEASPRPPPELAAAISRRLAEAEAPAGSASAPTPLIPWLTSWVRGPRRARPLAVAATLAIVAGAVLLGIFGRPIDKVRQHSIDLVDDGAPFVADEHGRCAGSPDARSTKATFRDARQAQERLETWVGGPVPVESILWNLDRMGWEFLGAGYCEVPVSDRSGHLMLTRRDSPAGPPMLSVFVVPDRGRYTIRTPQGARPLPMHHWVRVDAGHPITREVSIYSDGYVVYILVACYPAALDDAERALESAVFSAANRGHRGSDP